MQRKYDNKIEIFVKIDDNDLTNVRLCFKKFELLIHKFFAKNKRKMFEIQK